MEARDYPLQHFQMMARLAGRFREMPAQILEHTYHYSGFGSWWLNFNFAGVLYRFVLDVRESELTLERASEPRRQDFAVIASHRLSRGVDVEALVNRLVDALAAGAFDRPK